MLRNVVFDFHRTSPSIEATAVDPSFLFPHEGDLLSRLAVAADREQIRAIRAPWQFTVQVSSSSGQANICWQVWAALCR
ncbi:MAG TPA: hypothetical protein VGN39_05860, partial [Terriglobales bacterium]|nr:hypothetical protein [Terriglobales bacterium]